MKNSAIEVELIVGADNICSKCSNKIEELNEECLCKNEGAIKRIPMIYVGNVHGQRFVYGLRKLSGYNPH